MSRNFLTSPFGENIHRSPMAFDSKKKPSMLSRSSPLCSCNPSGFSHSPLLRSTEKVSGPNSIHLSCHTNELLMVCKGPSAAGICMTFDRLPVGSYTSTVFLPVKTTALPL